MFDHGKETRDLADNIAADMAANTAPDVAEMFSDDDQNSKVMEAMGELAEQIAVKNAECKAAEEILKADKRLLDEMKGKLGEMLMANNCKNGHKFDNGCYAKPVTNTKVFKAKGVDDEQLFAWLRSNELGDIIKDYVHWQTMNASCKEFTASGKNLPDSIFNVTTEQTMKFVGNGHVKFLAKLEQESEESKGDSNEG